MILDKDLILADGLDLTGISSGSNQDGQVVDLKENNDYAPGNVLWLVVRLSEGLDSDGSATLQTAIQHSVDDAAYNTYLQTPAKAYTKYTNQGDDIIAIGLPAHLDRYLKINFAVGTADLTAGQVEAYLTQNPSFPITQ